MLCLLGESLNFIYKIQKEVKMNGKKAAVLIGGVVAIVGQFWGAAYYLPLIGGAIALIAGLMIE